MPEEITQPSVPRTLSRSSQTLVRLPVDSAMSTTPSTWVPALSAGDSFLTMLSIWLEGTSTAEYGIM